MSPPNPGPFQQQPPAGGQSEVWPPAAANAARAAWPPPPTGQDQPVWFAFNEEYRRVEGNVSDFRTGWIGLGPEGILIRGKTVPRAEIKNPILLLCFILGLGLIIAYIIMEYAIRLNSTLQLGWDQVKKIVIAPKSRRICLVYTAPVGRKVKTFSLAARLSQEAYDAFVQAAGAYIPDRVVEGRIRGATSIVVWILLAILVSLILFGIVMAILSPSPR